MLHGRQLHCLRRHSHDPALSDLPSKRQLASNFQGVFAGLRCTQLLTQRNLVLTTCLRSFRCFSHSVSRADFAKVVAAGVVGSAAPAFAAGESC